MINTIDQFDIDNSYYPFIPKLKVKHYAMREISADIEDAKRLRYANLEKFSRINFEDRKESRDSVVLFEHPYKDEIISYVNSLADRMDIFSNYVRREYFSNLNARRNDCVINFSPIKIADLVGQYGIRETIDKLKEMNKFYNFFVDGTKTSQSEEACKDLTEQIEFEYPPLEWTKLTYIDTPEVLLAMINEIHENFNEIAVDLEHHNLESYLGITCLMQISTRLQDYVIDTIKLRPHIHELNKIFCNPSIVKVLHGADFDVEWLQKDFGVYIVNMFDTGQASRVLMLPSFSLANLLNTFCNITADKKYQLADWRIRPLPEDMLKYAREDTHYLLYIYDVLRKKLIYKSSLKNEDIMTGLLLTFKKSNEICLKQYTKPAVKSQEYYQVLGRNMTVLNKRNVSILKIIYKFRDYVGRKLDLNPHHVLTNKNMFNLLRLPGNKFDADTIYQNLDKNSHLRNFVPDLVKLIDVKLKKNEEKIDKGQISKFLEKTYLDNIKEKFGQSKTIVKNLKIFNKSENNVDILSINHISPITKEEVKQAGEEISLKPKKSSKFIDEIESKTASLQDKKEKLELDSAYNKVLENFSNFNIIAYLKEKNPKLKNLKIVKKEPVAVSKKTESISEEKLPAISKEKNQDERDEVLLKQKRKGPEHIDLTDYKRINLFTRPQEYSDDSDEQEANRKEKNYTREIKSKKSNIPEHKANLNSIQTESVKNMIASAKFLKGKISY